MQAVLAWVAAHQFILAGVVWMLVLGSAVGNYACSVVYRLPRGKTPFERHPYCGHCNADLKPVDLFPIISWLKTGGKCRYCGGEVPAVYTVIEIVCAAVLVTYFLRFSISEPFLLYSGYGVFVVILAAINWQQGWISASIYSYAFALLALARTLAENTIYGVVQSSFVMLVLMLCLMRLSKIRNVSPFEKPWIWWFVLLGALLPMAHWALIVPILIVKFLLPEKALVIVYAAAALALPLFI